MVQVEILIALCVAAGLAALFGVNPMKLFRNVSAALAGRPRTVRWYAAEVNGRHKGNFVTRRIRGANRVLEETGRGGKIDFYQTVSVAAAAAGFLIGLFTGNELLPVLFALLGYLAPHLYVLFTASTYWTKMNDSLHDGLKRINASFRLTGVFMSAVRRNLDTLADPLKTAMERFDYDVSIAGFDKAAALLRLKDRIYHPAFRMWCDAAIRCLDDPARYNELDCIESMVEDNTIKEQLDATIQNSILMVALFMGLAALIVPFLYMTFPELGGVLLTSFPGKIVIAILVILIFNGLLTIVRVSRPIRLKEGDE